MADIFYPGMPNWLNTLNQLAKGQLQPIQIDWSAAPGSVKAILNKPTLAAVATSGSKGDVGLGKVDNTADSEKPVSTAQKAALDLKANASSLATVATSGSKADVGLGNVDNTSDTAKPVSVLQANALSLKAPLDRPAFTGGISLLSAGTGEIIAQGANGYGVYSAKSSGQNPSIWDSYNANGLCGRLQCDNNAMTSSWIFELRKDGALGALLALDQNKLYPVVDGGLALGAAARRYTVVYSQTGSINTSDARLKTVVSPMSGQEIAAAIEIAGSIGTYRWLESIQAKGTDARIHIGTTVQNIITIMGAHNLDPFEYGFICYDRWDEQSSYQAAVPAQPPAIDAEGNVVVPAVPAVDAHMEVVREAGDLYSLRNDQLSLFIARGLSARMAEIETRLAAPQAV